MSSSLHATLHVKYCCVLWLEGCECCVRHSSSLVRRVNNFLHTSHCSSTLAYSLRHCLEQNVRRDSLRGVSQCKHHLEGLRLSPRSPCLLALVHTACLDTPSLRAISALLMPGFSARSSAICDEVITTSFWKAKYQCHRAITSGLPLVECQHIASARHGTTGSSC